MCLFGSFKMVRIHRSIDIPLHAIAMAITIVASSLQATVLIDTTSHSSTVTPSVAHQRRKQKHICGKGGYDKSNHIELNESSTFSQSRSWRTGQKISTCFRSYISLCGP